MKTLMIIGISVLLATAATAAPIEESIGVDEGKCETISIGFYFCKINGKCYSCGKNKDIDPKKDCFKEETCAVAMNQPHGEGLVKPPTRVVMRPRDDGHGHSRAVTPSVLCQRTD